MIFLHIAVQTPFAAAGFELPIAPQQVMR